MYLRVFGREILDTQRRSTTSDISSIKNPREWLQALSGYVNTTNVSVTPDSALTLPIYYGSIKTLSEDIAKIPGGVYRKNGDERQEINGHPIAKLLFGNPNKILNTFHWRISKMTQAIGFGSSYSLIVRNGDAKPLYLTDIEDPRDVTPFVSDGELWYKVRGLEFPVNSINMFHIRGIAYNGYDAKGILSVGSELIGGGLAQQRYVNQNYANGSLKQIALTTPQAGTGAKGLNPDVTDTIKKDFKNDRAKGDISVFPFGIEVKEIGLNPDEIKLIDSQLFTIQQFARMIRMPLSKIMELTNAHYNNIESESINYVTDTLMPWIVQFETEARNKLFTEAEKQNTYIKFNVNSLMRGDSKARQEFYQSAVLTGYMNRNEVRSLEELNPREGLSEYYVPVNTITPEIIDIIAKKAAAELQNIKKDGTNN